ncbi:MAG: FAD-dependent oxidoreductase [Candidatus Sumerlaeaceae bacterium]|nr:FAD-dependent oxidoreductase [Candidatus Sumerlaeaceae bacterium]
MALLTMSGPASAASYQADVVVVGGSFGAPAAALAAARTNPSAQVLLIEPQDWLGGQATAQGVSAIDNSWFNPGATLMRNNPSTYYAADYLDFLNRLKNKPPAAPGLGMAPNGTGWVTREAFDPRTGAYLLDQMMAEMPNLTVLKMTVVKSLQTSATADSFGDASVVTSMTLIQRTATGGYTLGDSFLSQELPDWYSPDNSTSHTKTLHTVTAANPAKGFALVDASETGDAIVLSGAKYSVGRELTTEEIGEDGSLPAANETGSQATVYPFCMTSSASPQSETALQTPWSDFATYYANQVATYFSISGYSWAQVWTYRRLYANTATPSNTVANTGDVSMQNWYPGNDFPYGSIYLDKAACAAQAANWQGGLSLTNLSAAEKHAVAWYFYMKANRTTSWDTDFLESTDTLNMMGTRNGLARFPYIRCGRRIVGLENYRLTQRYFVDTTAADYNNGPSYRFYDSVGIGNYACDVHPQKSTTGMSPSVAKPAPFYFPYRALGSANVRNLLAGCKNMATTFCSNSAYRLHPIEWAIGSAAGTAAALMARDGKTNMDLLQLSALHELQQKVVLNSPISWAAYDTQSTPTQNGDLILNGLKSAPIGKPFRAEIYHLAATKANLYRVGTFIGQTTMTKSNGRLIFDGLTGVATGLTTFTAECLDSSNTVLDTLAASITISSALPGAGQIVDDADGSPSFTLTGTWTNGTAQANKYATSYKYKAGSGNTNTPTGTATFVLPITQAGDYEVFIWYPEASNRATDSPFTVYFKGGANSYLKRINQRLTGGQWVSLGAFTFYGNNSLERVVLSNATSDGTNLVLADAVGIVSLGPPTPVTMSRFDLL